ncbi:MAG: HEAT repeat domain-containing protein, partial [Kiritimatiellia bacterium]
MSFRTKRGTLVFLFSGLAATLVAGTIPDGFRGKKVEVPRTWLTAREALELAYRQTRLRYAVVPPKFEGLLGPFSAGGTISLDKLINQIAEAAGATERVVGDVVVFDPPASPKVEPTSDSRQQVLRLALAGHSRTISPLCRLLAHDDASIRFHALAALYRMEGDFMRNTWPGRVSIFEVLREEIDRDALFFMLEEGGYVGGREWTMAMEILGRARNPYLVRFGWSPIWEKVPGTITVAVWAMGRSGDADGRNSISKRLRQHFTNDPADRYLAALSLGELDERGELCKHLEHVNPDVRRAAVLGLGLCSESPALLAALDTALKDADPVVRFIACQSLGRIATPTAINRLKELAESQAQPLEVRCAALAGLSLAGTRTAAAGILVAASDANPVVKARATELLGESVGAVARAKLLELLKDSDRWVRAAAAYSLGLIGDEQAVDAVSAYIRNKDTDTDGIIAALIGL